MASRKTPGISLARIGVWLIAAAVFIAPLALVISLALGGNQIPVLLEQGLGKATWNSVYTTLASAVGAVIIGAAIALLLERTDVKGTGLLRLLLLSPLLVPPFVGAISWLQLFGRNQGLNAVFGRSLWDIYGADGIIFLMTLHSYPVVYVIVSAALPGLIIGVGWVIMGRYTGIYNTRWVILAAYVCAFSAMVLQAVRAPLAKIPTAVEEAAQISGAGRLRAIWDTSGRMALPAVISGAVLVAVTAVRELTVSILLVAPGSTTIGVQLFNLQQSGNYNQASALALLFMIIGIAALAFTVRKSGKE